MRRVFILRNREIQSRCGSYIAGLNPGESSLYRVSVEPYKDDQAREHQEKYHAMIGDIARQLEWMGKKRDTETWKRLLIEAFVHVMREQATAQGKPDPFLGRGEVVPSLDGQRVDFLTIPLCPGCHTGPMGIHGDKTMMRIAKVDEMDLLNDTLKKLYGSEA
jgi:hypothetical protein